MMAALLHYDDAGRMPASESARIGVLLDLPDRTGLDDVGLARIVARGLSPKSAVFLGKLLTQRFRIDGALVPEATLRRMAKSDKPLSRDHSERLYEIGRVVDAAGRLFRGDSDSISTFLTRPHPMLDGESPIDMARSGSAGCTAVLNLIRRAEAGVSV